MKKIVALLLIASISLMGCASKTPNPIPIAQVGDETKSCDAIANEMQQMNDTKLMAEGDGDSQVGKNVALGITGIFLIVPWFFMDLGNAATVEQKAAQARYQRLQQMAIDKKCPKTPVMKPDITVLNSDLESLQVDPNAPVTKTSAAGVTTKSQNLAPESSAAYPITSPKGDDLPNPLKRLDDLNSLLKKGLITQKDYDLKKAEILKNL
jgi:hypothetical protein